MIMRTLIKLMNAVSKQVEISELNRKCIVLDLHQHLLNLECNNVIY